MKHVLLTSVGSLGDIFPPLAIAKSLAQAGIAVKMISSPAHRETITAHCIPFRAAGKAIRPWDYPDFRASGASDREVNDFLDYAVFSQLTELHHDIRAAAEEACAIVAPYYIAPAHLVAEELRIPYIACALSPAFLALTKPHSLHVGRTDYRAPPQWHDRIATLRKARGLPRRVLPYTGVLRAAACILGLFPRFLMPDNTRDELPMEVVGYPFLEESPRQCIDAELVRFADDATVLFSFGSHVDHHSAEYLFTESVAACRSLGLKCLYISEHLDPALARQVPAEGLITRGFVPHDSIFPRVGIVVHHGGIGTLAAACAHRKPMVIVPFFHDQPYHARRTTSVTGCPVIAARSYDRHSLREALLACHTHRSQFQERLVTLMKHEGHGAGTAAARIMTVLGS